MLTYDWYSVWNKLVIYVFNFTVLVSNRITIDRPNAHKVLGAFHHFGRNKVLNVRTTNLEEPDGFSLGRGTPSFSSSTANHPSAGGSPPSWFGYRVSPWSPHYLPYPKSLLLNCFCSTHDTGPGGSQLFIRPGKTESSSPLWEPLCSPSGSAQIHVRNANFAWAINQQMRWRGLERRDVHKDGDRGTSMGRQWEDRVRGPRGIRDDPELGPQRKPHVCDGDTRCQPITEWAGRAMHIKCPLLHVRAKLQAEPLSLEVPGTSELPL